MKFSGLTLIELVVVVAVLAVLAAALVPRMEHIDAAAMTQATRSTMNTLRDAILGDDRQPGFVADLGHWPDQIHDLLRSDHLRSNDNPKFDINTRRGWNGPYVRSSAPFYTKNTIDENNGFADSYFTFFNNQDTVIVDGWNHPLVIQELTSTGIDPLFPLITHRLVSAGPDGVLTTTPAMKSSDVNVGDDIILPLQRAGNVTP